MTAPTVEVKLEKKDIENFLGAAHQLTELVERKEKEYAKLGEATAETKGHIAEINGRLDILETALRRPRASDLAPSVSEAKDAFYAAIRNGCDVRDLKPEQKSAWEKSLNARWHSKTDTKALSITDNTLGGYLLAPPDFVDDVIKQVVLYSPIRSFASVYTTTKVEMDRPVRTGLLSAQWTSETGNRVETTGALAYGMVRLVAGEMYSLVLMSKDLMEDSAFNLDQFILDDIVEQFGVAEGAAFVNGNGKGKPQGLLFNTDVSSDNNGDATTLKYSGLVNVLFQLKSPYVPNARWLMNRKTLGLIRQMVDGNGRPIWLPATSGGLADGNPATILDLPYTETVDMPDVANGTTPILVGDIKRAYTVLDRVQMEVIRLNELFAQSGQVGLMVRKRVGGQVVLPEAIRKLKMA